MFGCRLSETPFWVWALSALGRGEGCLMVRFPASLAANKRGCVTWTPPITYVCLGLWISCWHCQDIGTEEKAFWQWLQHPTDRQRWSLEGHLCLNWLGSGAWHGFSDSRYFRLCGTYSLFGTIQLCCCSMEAAMDSIYGFRYSCQTLIEPTQ